MTTDTANPPCQLYLITPPTIKISNFCDQLKAALDGGPVAALQIRLKQSSDDEICQTAEAILAITKPFGIPVIMNDRPDLAKKCGADGVHIGQQDSRYDQARSLLGPDSVIGVTCHNSKHLSITAAEQGADYVAFGAFFPSSTKNASTRAELDLLKWWHEIMVVPSVAIGGITHDNCSALISAGADFLAVVSAVWDYPGGAYEAVKHFNQIITDINQ